MTEAMCALEEASKGSPALAKLPVVGIMLLVNDGAAAPLNLSHQCLAYKV